MQVGLTDPVRNPSRPGRWHLQLLSTRMASPPVGRVSYIWLKTSFSHHSVVSQKKISFCRKRQLALGEKSWPCQLIFTQ